MKATIFKLIITCLLLTVSGCHLYCVKHTEHIEVYSVLYNMNLEPGHSPEMLMHLNYAYQARVDNPELSEYIIKIIPTLKKSRNAFIDARIVLVLVSNSGIRDTVSFGGIHMMHNEIAYYARPEIIRSVKPLLPIVHQRVIEEYLVEYGEYFKK